MGIRGLYRFIFEIPGLVKPYKLHDSYVVIDGTNLFYSIYFDYKINNMYGGDYNKYAESIRRYFHLFLECSIKPIIVFDGGYDESHKKNRTLLKRTQQRISFVKNVSENKVDNNHPPSSGVIPLLSMEVFICILKELDVPFVVCDFEADDHITALANYYKCPIISADTDFFIFDVHYGFIVRHSIQPTVISEDDSNGKKYKYLNCYMYYIDDFVSRFPGIEKAVLPLFATLIGNDYAQEEDFDDFFISMQLPNEERIRGLLNWLKEKSLNDAISQIIQYSVGEKQEYVKYIIDTSVESYDLHDCSLRHIINQKLNRTKYEYSFFDTFETPCGNSLPLDFVIKYHSGHYPSLIIPNIIISHKSFLSLRIDDLSACSSHMCARYIRRVIYGILIRHDVDGCACQNEECLGSVVEYDRHEAGIGIEFVEPIFGVEGIGMLPKINELSNLEKEKSKLIIIKVLGLNLDFIMNLPAEWQLFLACVNYCIYNSVPCFTEEFLYALILNLIYCDVIRRMNPYQNVVSNSCSKSAEQNHACSSITCILSKISPLELQHAAKKLKSYLYMKTINHDNLLYLKILHSYNQLQCCILSVVSLNNLLGPCMINPDIHRYFNGSLLYNLTKDISTWSNPNSFVAGILGRKTALSTLFILLRSKMCYDIPSHYILKDGLSCR